MREEHKLNVFLNRLLRKIFKDLKKIHKNSKVKPIKDAETSKLRSTHESDAYCLKGFGKMTDYVR